MSLVNYFTVTLLTLVIKIVCLLVTIAYYTLAERKIMASVQRRLGPNVVGFWGLLQPVSDGLKLFGKELVIPTHANSRIFIFAPIGVLLCAFLGWSVIPFCLFDHSTTMSTAAIRECLVSTSFCSFAYWPGAIREKVGGIVLKQLVFDQSTTPLPHPDQLLDGGCLLTNYFQRCSISARASQTLRISELRWRTVLDWRCLKATEMSSWPIRSDKERSRRFWIARYR